MLVNRYGRFLENMSQPCAAFGTPILEVVGLARVLRSQTGAKTVARLANHAIPGQLLPFASEYMSHLTANRR